MGQTVITQKFELNELKTQNQSLKEENKKLQELYNNLAAHCRTTAYIDCEETHDMEPETTRCTASSTQEPSRTVTCSSRSSGSSSTMTSSGSSSSSESSSSSGSTSSSGIEILPAKRATPQRPTPRIIRFVRTNRATRDHPECTPSCTVNGSNIDTK